MDKGEEAVGSIYWDGEGFRFGSGRKELLDRILDLPVYLANNVEVYSHKDPERWITSLFLHYKSPYLRASEAEQVNAIEKAVKFVPSHTSKTKTGKVAWVTAYHAQKKEKELEPHKASKVFAGTLLGESWDLLSDESKIELQRAYDTDAQIWEGQTIGQHTKMVLDRFDRYFAKSLSLEGNFTGLTESGLEERDARKLFRIFLALHDVGKAIAIQTTGDKNKQHEYAAAAVTKYMTEMQFPKNQIFSDMAAQDNIGKFLGNPKIGVSFPAQKIVDLASKHNMVAFDMFNLLKTYFMCDAGSYTKDAGNYESLDHLFRFHKKGSFAKIYDRDTMEFSPDAKRKVEALKDEIIKLDQVAGDYTLAFHGTSGEYLKSIIEKGLENKLYHNFGEDLYTAARGKNVFVTMNVDDASYFAQVAAARASIAAVTSPVILKLKIPKDFFVQGAVPDYLWNPASAFMLPEIKPEWIEEVAEGKKLDLPFSEEVVGTTAQRNEKMFATLFKTIWERIQKATEDFVIVYLPESMENWLQLKEKLGEVGN